ncbi:hypothetical protein D3C74_463750 [compost metagenome]
MIKLKGIFRLQIKACLKAVVAVEALAAEEILATVTSVAAALAVAQWVEQTTELIVEPQIPRTVQRKH